MYVIIENGGKQYKVKEKDVLEVEKVDKAKGERIKIDKVLFISNDNIKIGRPYLEGSSVDCTILEHSKGDKKIAFKYRRRKKSKVTKGHRQSLTKIRVDRINVA